MLPLSKRTKSPLGNSVLMQTLTALFDQFRRGFLLFLKNIFLKWVYDSGFSVGTSEGSNLRCSLTTEYTHKIPSPSNLQIRFLHIGVFFRFSLQYTRREAKAMKKIIILLLALLMSACSVVKPSGTLSSMQTEAETETTVAEMVSPEKTTETTPKETESVIETQRAETTAPFATEQKLAPETAATTVEAPAEPINTETTTEPPKTPAEAVEAENRQRYRKPSKRRLRAAQSRRKRSSMSTTGSTSQGPTRFKSGLKSTRRRWTAGITRRPPTPTAFTLSGI